MEYKSQNVVCQNCKIQFTIDPEDFNFYEKIKVPPPTFCPECRFQRRMVWRNERTFYKRDCDLCKKKIISMFPAETTFPVYCKDCWYGDGWEATDFGRDYDFSKTFFEQFRDLSLVVPRLALWQRSLINSPYTNFSGESKNVYLSVSVVVGSENVFYSRSVDKSSNIFDSLNVRDSDSCYQNIDAEKNYNCFYATLSKNCVDSYFIYDCSNCSDCFMCSNLRNKKYHIRNKQYSEEEYQKEKEKFGFESRKKHEELIKEFEKLTKNAIHKYATILKSLNSTGNNLSNVKNCKYCFDTYNTENMKYGYRCFYMKDSMDLFFSASSELLYEYTSGSLHDFNVKFSYSALDQVQNAEYAESCISSSDLFGCSGIKNKQCVILNKVYSKEKYDELIAKIKKQMEDMPYIDKKGRIYKYGEFFPIEIGPYAYNETAAQDYFPLNKERAKEEGYGWKESEVKDYKITLEADKIPDNIKDIEENILNEVLGCSHNEKCSHQCMKAFRLTKDEFSFYKKHNIPVPNKCSNCRYYERFNKMLPTNLWHRKCMKEGCNNEFETSYAPERPETVYCEECYNKEVY